jgi:hypothetical protein
VNDNTRRHDSTLERANLSRRQTPTRRGAFIRWLNRAAESIIGVSALIALLFMIAVLAAGMYELYVAIRDFFWHSPEVVLSGGHPDAVSGVEHAAAKTNAAIIEALEMFILAPIAYLTLVSLQFYVSRFIGFTVAARARGVAGHGVDSSAQDSSGLEAQEDRSLERLALLPKIKALIASMLVSLVAVHLVGSVLKGEISWPSAAPQLAIIIVLGAYFMMLERMAHEPRNGRSPHEE